MDFKRALQFLTKLKKNNNKEWFDKNRNEYDELRKEILDLVTSMIKRIQSFDQTLAGLEAKQCMFRINRDIRFSKDKTPYKTNFGLTFNRDGKSSQFAGYYLHIQPGECFIAGGSYAPLPEHLAAIRQEIDYHFDEFKKIILNKDFRKYFGELSGEKLSRPPKGYEMENPAVEFLKHKAFLMWHKFDEKKLLEKDFEKYCATVFKAMKPALDFMNRAIEG
ncbi:MAG: DUF2461 domain-containing protein [Bacteroidia bacterium]